MTQINMDGRLSFLLKDIKQVVRQGGNVTHILNIKVSRQPSAEVGKHIKTAIFNFIANIPIQKIVNGHAISFTWRTSATTTSAYYHCDAGCYNDIAVKEHTKILLRDLLKDLDAQFNNIFVNGTTGVAFLVSKPLVREVVLVDDDIPPLAAAIGGEKEQDEAAENN